MELIEVNMQLKEDIAILETEYKNLVEAYKSLLWMPSLIHTQLKTIELMCSQQVLAQRGEKCSMTKFESTEEFAKYLEMMVGITIKSIEDKYNVK